MKKLVFTLLMIILTVALAIAAGGDKKMAIQDSLAIRIVANPEFSPDGKWIAYTISDWDKENNRRVSHIYLAAAESGKAGNGKSIKLTNGEKGESSPQWSPDGTRLAFLADRDKGNQIWLISPFGGEAEKLTTEENPATGFSWSPDSRHIAYVTRDTPKDKAEREKKKKDKFDTIVVEQGFTYSHLWAIDVETKARQRITEGDFSVESAAWSPDGKWIAFVRSKNGASDSGYGELSPDRNTDIYIISAAGGQARQLTTNPAPDNNPKWSPDGKWLAYTASGDPKSWAAKTDIMVIASAGGTPINITGDFHESAGNGLLWAKQNNTIYFSSASGVASQLLAIPVKPDGSFANGPVTISKSANRVYGQFDVSKTGEIACVINDNLSPGDLYIQSGGEGRAENQITFANPQLKDFALAATDVIRWKGADNFDVEGLLVKPLGYEAGKRYPLILQIHGGPYGRFDNGFNSRAQIFAANGYAVLMPNPRGSTGYGIKFAQANLGDWGGKDFQDIMAGVDAAIAKGIADPDKLVVMGGSYGGYMTFWTITQTDRFKAAIGHAGISDWYSFHGQSDIPGLMEYGFLGQPWNATQNYRKSSPMTYVDKVKTPILITHGEQDRRVAIAQAEEYYRALQRRGVEVVFLRYPREGHGIQEPNHQIDLVTRQLDWFDSHLGIKRPRTEVEKALPVMDSKH